MLPRTTAVVALAQTLVVILGFIAVGVVLKASGYPNSNPQWVSWNPLTLFLRHHGLYLLLFPLLWTYLTTRSLSDDSRTVSYRTMLLIGAAFTVIVLLSFIYAAVRPFTRPFIMSWQ